MTAANTPFQRTLEVLELLASSSHSSHFFMIFLLRRISLYSCLGVTSLFSQGVGPGVPVQVRTFGAVVAPADLYYDYKGVDTKVTVIDSARSVFMNHSDKNPIVFYRLVPGPAGKPVREEAAVAPIADAGTRPLVVFMQTANSPQKYQVSVLADDPKAFPFPSCRFINLSALDIDVAYGSQSLKVKALGTELIDSGLKSAQPAETRYTTLSTPTPNGPRLLYSNNWMVRPNQRTLVFIVSQGDGLQVTRIVDDQGSFAETPATP